MDVELYVYDLSKVVLLILSLGAVQITDTFSHRVLRDW